MGDLYSPVAVERGHAPGQVQQARPWAGMRELLADLIERAFGLALESVERLADAFDRLASSGGVPLNALVRGFGAVLAGRSPVWGVLTGAVSALSPAAKATLLLALVLALLLLPLTVVLLLLALIVLAVAGLLAKNILR